MGPFGFIHYYNASNCPGPRDLEAKAACFKSRLTQRSDPQWRVEVMAGSVVLCDGPIATDPAVILAGSLRLDNAREIREALGLADDCGLDELLLQAWHRWGEDLGRHLVGDYALVVISRSSRKVFAVRDALGAVPLYFHRGREMLVVSTSAAAMSFLPEIGRKASDLALWMWLQNDYDDRVSMYAGIEGLGQGCCLTLRGETLRQRRYWFPGEIKLFSRGEMAEAGPRWLALLERCVADRCAGHNGLVGTTISGGMDSSSVSALAKRCGQGAFSLQAYAFKFDTMPDCDERALSMATAAHLGVDTLFFEGDEHLLLQDVLLDGRQREMPFTGFHAFDRAILADLAAKGGKILLTGHGGDNINTGIREQDLLGGLLQQGVLSAGTQLRRDFGFSYKALVWRFFVAPLLPGLLLDKIKRARVRVPAWVPAQHRQQWVEITRRFGQKTGVFWRHDRQALYEMLLFHAAGIRRVIHYYNDLASAYGISVRHPYFDRRLVSFMLALDPALVRPGPLSKQFCRQNMEGILPNKVLNTLSKPLLGAFYHKSVDKERNKVKILMERSALADRGFVDQSALLSTVEAYLEGNPNHEFATFLTSLMVENWLQNEGLG